LRDIYEQIRRHRAVVCWNLFQYTPTDQAAESVNNQLTVDEATFLQACSEVAGIGCHQSADDGLLRIEARTIRSRLGQYLLVNGDGRCWLPDEHGRTIDLGRVNGREHDVLRAWAGATARLTAASEAPAPVGSCAGVSAGAIT
jgi:hypothetical protein